jgi:hypothetical protein
MKTILVPTHHIATMKSTLEVAVLLARRTGAYIEGFPLRIAIPPYVVAELTAGFTVEAYDAQRDEETRELRRLFETFMQGRAFRRLARLRSVPLSDGLPSRRKMKALLATMVARSTSRS